MDFIRKTVLKMAKVKDIRNLFNSRKEADTPALVASVTDDVSVSELLILENEIKKIDPSKNKNVSPMSRKRSKQRLEHIL